VLLLLLLLLQADGLGFKVLDEPTANQSDATVLELQLRAVSKKRHGDVAVRSMENAHRSPQEIERWIASIAELHRSKPPAQVRCVLNGFCPTACVKRFLCNSCWSLPCWQLSVVSVLLGVSLWCCCCCCGKHCYCCHNSSPSTAAGIVSTLVQLCTALS
jgi:Intraflagellar transport complex B protein 46 C terminal